MIIIVDTSFTATIATYLYIFRPKYDDFRLQSNTSEEIMVTFDILYILYILIFFLTSEDCETRL